MNKRPTKKSSDFDTLLRHETWSWVMYQPSKKA